MPLPTAHPVPLSSASLLADLVLVLKLFDGKQQKQWNHPGRGRPASPHIAKMSKIQMNDSVEDFFERIKELDRERVEERQPKKQLTSSESINDFNSSVSEQYRLNVDDLVYESAYNYEKSRNEENDSPTFRARRQSYKKHEGIDIVRFDDFVTKKPAQRSTATSRYSKFELSDEEKREIDDVIISLIGESPEEEIPPKLPARRTTHSDVEESKTQRSRSSSPIKRSPAKIDISIRAGDTERPPLPARRLGFTDEQTSLITNQKNSKPEVKPKGKWINDALRHSSSTFSQGTPTKPNFSIDHSHPRSANRWLNSAVTNSSSTPQGKNTSFKVSIDHGNSPVSWLESAKKTNSTTIHTPQRAKIAPIVPSKSNTLTAILKEDEISKSRSEKALKELSSPSLNHIERSPSKLKPQLQTKELSPIVLKKVRPPAPQKSRELSTSLQHSQESKLNPHISISKSSMDAPEVIRVSKSLKPAVPVRKASIKIPEALAKKGTLKNAKPLPEKTKVVLEAIEKKRFLKEAQLMPVKKDAVPEAVEKSQRLKPVKPTRKPSVKQLEALQALENLKKNDLPEIKAKPRVLSNSKAVLNNQLKSLTSIKKKDPPKTNEDPRKAILERVLQRAQTTPIPIASDDTMTPIKKASTFDSSQLQKGGELTHLTKTRSKGPKRRAPKTT
jgi:hypothetical protein